MSSPDHNGDVQPPERAKRPTRRDLLLVIGELQDLIGAARAAYDNDRASCRASEVRGRLDAAFDLAVKSRSFDPPLDGRWTP